MTIITLIHGTWARRAPWANEESPLATALRERIRGDVRIKTFEWSGRNLHCARRRAASDLRKHIAATKEAFPDARHFLVAHSHGGVVALYAMADPETLSRVSGVTCLATPFIISRPRAYPEGVFGALGLLYGFGIYALLAKNPPSWYPTQLPVLVAALIVTVLSILIVRSFLAWCVLGELKGSFDAIYYRTVESFSLPTLSSNKLLVLRAAGDEASGILAASAFASWVVGMLSRLIQLIYGIATVLSEISDAMGDWGARGKESRDPALGPTGKEFVIFVPFYLTWIASLVLRSVYVVLLIPLLLLCIIFSVPFGIDAALAAIFVEFSVESTPIGRAPVLSLNASAARGLWHSLPYNDSEAFEAIVNWINGHREEEDQPIRLSDLAVAIRNYTLSHNRFDLLEVEDRLTALEASHEKIATNVGLTKTFSDRIAARDLREPVRTILSETTGLFRTLRALTSLDIRSQMEELGQIANRLDRLDKDLAREIKVWNEKIVKLYFPDGLGPSSLG